MQTQTNTDQDRRDRLIHLAIIMVGHFVLAVIYKELVGLDMSGSGYFAWDDLWQTYSIDLLRQRPLESIWYLHTQPPGLNAYGALLVRLFYPHHFQVMQFINIVLGTALSGMIYIILLNLTDNKKLSFIWGLILALFPALFLYEAYPLYTTIVAFLTTASVFCLSLYKRQQRPVYLHVFILSLNLLVLTRSLYHLLIILPVGILIAVVISGQDWRRVLVGALLLSSIATGWYAKNAVMYGFFGASSWGGYSLWHITQANYSDEQLYSFCQQGIIDCLPAEQRRAATASAYVPFGFDETSDIPALNADDRHNINIIAVGRVYGDSARRLIKYQPLHYLVNVAKAYLIYVAPSSKYEHLIPNAQKIALHEAVFSQIIQGQWFISQIVGLVDPASRPPASSFFVTSWQGNQQPDNSRISTWLIFLLPLNLVLYGRDVLRQNGLSIKRWQIYMQNNPDYFFTVFIIAYTTVIGCLLEYGENHRFKFLVEPLIWSFIIVYIYRYSRRPAI